MGLSAIRRQGEEIRDGERQKRVLLNLFQGGSGHLETLLLTFVPQMDAKQTHKEKVCSFGGTSESFFEKKKKKEKGNKAIKRQRP